MEGDDRPRGILSQVDRDYLHEDDDEYTPQARYKREQAISERVKNGIIDASILFEHLDDETVEEVFEGHDKILTNSEGVQQSALSDGIVSLIALLYRGVGRGITVYFEAGIKRALRREGLAADVKVSIDDPYPLDVDDMLERLRSNEKLTDDEIRYLLVEEVVEPNEIRAYLRQQ